MRPEARSIGLLLAVVVAAAAACQPLPRPFQPHSKLSSPARLIDIGPRAGILVGPVAGAPEETSARLGALVAAGLRDLDVPATVHASGSEGYVLEAEASAQPVAESDALLNLRWRLVDPFGAEAGAFEQVKQVSAADWEQASPVLLALLAGQAVPRVDGIVDRLGVDRLGLEPPEASPAPVVVTPVDGAPGDGRMALASAMRAALAERAVPLADDIGDDTYLVLGSVYVEEAGGGEQTVEVYWTVIDASGAEVGVVSQRNRVTQGQLDGVWGGVAEAVAQGGAEGVVGILGAAGPPKGAPASE